MINKYSIIIVINEFIKRLNIVLFFKKSFLIQTTYIDIGNCKNPNGIKMMEVGIV